VGRLLRQARHGTLEESADSLAPPVVHDVLRTPGEPLDAAARAFMEPRFGHDFSKVRVYSNPTSQAGLTVNKPDDESERVADRIAESALGHPENRPGARHDFSQVRVHTDARAAESAAAVRAKAYTFGRDIVFGPGEYAPSTEAGRRLLAHELAHTIQHGFAGSIPAPSTMSIARQPKPGAPDAGPQDETGEDTQPVDRWQGTLVSEIIISLARHRVGFRVPQGMLLGTVDTDLPVGKYDLKAVPSKQQWTIEGPGVKAGLRFDVDLSESIANPWTLSYPDKLTLIVGAGSAQEPKTYGDMLDEQGGLKDPLWLYEGGGGAIPPAPVAGVDDYETIETVQGTPPHYRIKYRDKTERLLTYGELTPNMKAQLRAYFQKADEDFLNFELTTFPMWWSIVSITPMAPMPSAGARPYIPGRVPLAKGEPPVAAPVGEPPAGALAPLQRPAAGQPPESAPAAPQQQGTTAPGRAAAAASESVAVPMLQTPKGPGVAYGQQAAARLATQGKTGAAILRPLVDDLNAQPNLTPIDKATAMQVACNSQGSTFGAGPIAQMPNGNLVVTPRAPNPTAPVIIVQPNGTVLRGNANVTLVNNNTAYQVSNVTVRQ